MTSGGAMNTVATPIAAASMTRAVVATAMPNPVRASSASGSVVVVVLMVSGGSVGGDLLCRVFEREREAGRLDQPRLAVAPRVDAQVQPALVEDGDGHQLGAAP